MGIIGDYKIRSDKEFWITVDRLWECESLKGKIDKPAGNLFRGMLTGIFRGFFNRDVVVKETECIAIGDDHCKFEATIIY
jgi:predicted hydrocarbon binding protein